MKYKEGNFIQLTSYIFEPDYLLRLSDAAFKLFVLLSHYEHKYTNGETNRFFSSDEKIASELDWSISKVRRAKSELAKIGLIKICKAKKAGCTWHITAYELKY